VTIRTGILSALSLACTLVCVPAGRARVQAVALFGPWQLLEGVASDGTFQCSLGMEGLVRGLDRGIQLGFRRGQSKMLILVWQGNVIFGGDPAKATIRIRFDNGFQRAIPAQMQVTRALSDPIDPSVIFAQVPLSAAFTVEVEGFQPLTATTDGLSGGLEAVKRCVAGETIPPPETNAPLR
jgi:hypothetical protein